MIPNSFRVVLLSLAVILSGIELSAQRIVCDETCKLADAPPEAAKKVSGPSAQTKTATVAKKQTVAPTPEWYDSPEDEQMTIPTMKRGMTAFIITGDASRNKVQTMPGGGYATIEIELPRNWNSLMANLGYAPLSEYLL